MYIHERVCQQIHHHESEDEVHERISERFSKRFSPQVGSADPQDDVVRARAIREEIGDDNFLMMDANQVAGHHMTECNSCERTRHTGRWVHTCRCACVCM